MLLEQMNNAHPGEVGYSNKQILWSNRSPLSSFSCQFRSKMLTILQATFIRMNNFLAADTKVWMVSEKLEHTVHKDAELVPNAVKAQKSLLIHYCYIRLRCWLIRSIAPSPVHSKATRSRKSFAKV